MPKTLEAVTPASPSTNGHSARRLLTGAEIRGATTLPYEDVPTDEWGEGTATRVTAMDFDSKDMWQLAQIAFSDDKTGQAFRGVRRTIVGRCIVNEKMERQFTDEQIDQLGKLHPAPIMRCWMAIQKLSKVDKLDEEIEEAVKN